MAIDGQPSVDLEAEDQQVENQETGALDAEPVPSFNESSVDEEPADETSLSESPLSEESSGEAFLNTSAFDKDTAIEPSPSEPFVSEPIPPAPDNQEAREAVPQLNDLGDLSINLMFVVDQFNAALKEIEQVKAGYVFELDKKPAGQVQIRANGALIGTGELVQIEDRAGVRILKLYNQKETEND